jgi:DNA-binding transcriptional LysR family regulator
MADRLSALKVFSRVARLGSFSRAGRELGVSQPSVSRIVVGLERELGAALLIRTTRAISLTEAGADYLARVEPLLDAMEDADHAIRGDAELRGRLRIGLSSSFSVREVIPGLPRFMDHHPLLQIDLVVADQHQNLIVEGVDVALRFGVLVDSSATARLLDASPRLLLASPEYLMRAGQPAAPQDLSAHSVIAGPGSSVPAIWSFQQGARKSSVRLEGRLTISSNEGAVAAAVSGLGIVATSFWGCRAELERGQLVQLLADWEMDLLELHAVFPAGRAAKPAARKFVDHLVEDLRQKRRSLAEQPRPSAEA